MMAVWNVVGYVGFNKHEINGLDANDCYTEEAAIHMATLLMLDNEGLDWDDRALVTIADVELVRV